MTSTINIQSISDLITNSSTEVFVVYEKSNIQSIKDIVDAVLSLIDPSKKFDDYFNIEMNIDYDELDSIFERYSEDTQYYGEIPELKVYSDLDYEKTNGYLYSLPTDRIEEIIDWANNVSWRDYRAYEGISITAKSDDPVVKRVAEVIGKIDDIFYIDYNNNY